MQRIYDIKQSPFSPCHCHLITILCGKHTKTDFNLSFSSFFSSCFDLGLSSTSASLLLPNSRAIEVKRENMFLKRRA
jgi:hypothetical protein